jgi:DNA sulfur modification protein DndE
MSLDHIRISEQAKEQLVRLKRSTRIKNWNVLCRWALCVSLADPTIPPNKRIASDSSVEMSWKVFGGEYQGVYFALLKQRCKHDGFGTSTEVLAQQLKLHLHRGIGQLAVDRNLKSIAGLVGRAAIISHPVR